MLRARRAIISVFDKRDLVDFAKGLDRLGIEIISTGGTYQALQGVGVKLLRVADVTGFPEVLDGRVKTLHPKLHGGILADRERASHAAALREHGITPIDLVVVNLYPFRKTAESPRATFEQLIEMIDIGGPAMVRAGAKNHKGVVVVVDPDDYPQVLAALEESDGRVPETLRRRLALKAFRHTQAYDAAISKWLEHLSGTEDDDFPRHLLLDLQKEATLRYGENPHQAAALYRLHGGGGILGGFEQLQGKQLSFNNLLDIDAAAAAVALFEAPAVAIIKHNNPCGVGQGTTLLEAYERALACDPISAFGSVVAMNREVGPEVATAITSRFVEVAVAPAFSTDALTKFSKKPTLRIISTPNPQTPTLAYELRPVGGGFLAQTHDRGPDDESVWSCQTRRSPSQSEGKALTFAWKAVRAVRSNAIVIANEYQTVGIGAGQMSRVDSCKLALAKAQLEVPGCVAASDGFFPFRDGLDVLAEAGIRAVIQPGGSKRDDEVIAAADEHDIALVMTARRHFKH
jgi:phosphoribosylaminoimidazolecarboxamide formyltransferase/IMP cyclohydrolase